MQFSIHSWWSLTFFQADSGIVSSMYDQDKSTGCFKRGFWIKPHLEHDVLYQSDKTGVFLFSQILCFKLNGNQKSHKHKHLIFCNHPVSYESLCLLQDSMVKGEVTFPKKFLCQLKLNLCHMSWRSEALQQIHNWMSRRKKKKERVSVAIKAVHKCEPQTLMIDVPKFTNYPKDVIQKITSSQNLFFKSSFKSYWVKSQENIS